MERVLETQGLTVGYPGKEVLRDIGMALHRGELAVLIGANGSGKSTFLRTISALQPPLAGHTLVGGMEVSSYSRRELARLMTVVSTERTGGGALTVSECVAIGRHPHTGPFGRLSANDKAIVADSIRAVGLADKSTRYLGTLSDGERQKVMIARALAQQTTLIILDEPTAFLDVAGRIDTMRLLRSLADSGHAILLSTHDIAPAVAQADSLLVVDPAQKSISAGTRTDIIDKGILDRAFADSGLHFDPLKGDYYG